jgi:pfkB family carbohydrate kinase
MSPDVLVLGQITVDDTVPSTPGHWLRQLGGNALYAAAGARLWCDPKRIGVVARVAADLPFDVAGLLENVGLTSAGLKVVQEEALVEWIVYEEDGSRQSLPRNRELRDPAASVEVLLSRYLIHLELLSAGFDDIPKDWLPARAVHLAPQVLNRHHETCRALATQTEFLSVDPSPHYSRYREASALVDALPGTTAFLPSQAEVQHMGKTHSDWLSVVTALCAAGFPEVVIKLGAEGALVGTRENDEVRALPVATATPRDLTGAGDVFSGAYAANRALGVTPQASVERAAVTAAMAIECSGVHGAFQLRPDEARLRLNKYTLQAR